MKLIRKFSAPLTLVTLLSAAYAAPYLLPADPDSAVFRSGVLGLILLFACAAPVTSALRTQSMRALIYGTAFGFAFAAALSLGSELAFYDRLLPGMGSMIRRLCVPVMITPLFGALSSYLFAFAPPAPKQDRRGVPFLYFFAAFALCYALVLLAFYPGVVRYDFEHEIRQYQTGAFEAAHPVFHTLFLGSLYRLGEALFGSMTAGAALYSAVQLLLLAALYAWGCAFVSRRVPLGVSLVLAACFALLPFHGVMAVSTAKDPLFAGLCAALCLMIWEIAEDPAAFLASRMKQARLIACCALLALLRRNGVFAFLPACAAGLLLTRGLWRRSLPVWALALVLSFALPMGLDMAVQASSAPSSEMMAIPCQQLMRTAAHGDLPQADYDEISTWFSGAIHRYHPHNADPAKGGNFDFARYQADPGAYWRMYLKYAARHPRIYVEAFLENCAGLWYPDDVSHATQVAGEAYDFVYLMTDYEYEPDRYDIHRRSLLPKLKSLIYDYTHHNAAQETPVLAQLFCPAVYVFALLFLSLRLCCKGRGRFALCALPLWGIWLSLLFSAGVFIRYAYPLMAAAPMLLTLALYADAAS